MSSSGKISVAGNFSDTVDFDGDPSTTFLAFDRCEQVERLSDAAAESLGRVASQVWQAYGALMAETVPQTSGLERLEAFLARVYEDLRRMAIDRMAQERPGISIQATELVHEAYLRLLRDGEMPQWENRAHFFGAAAEAMRRTMVDRARRRNSLKRGGGRDREPLRDVTLGKDADGFDLVALDASLAKLALQSPRHAEVVTLKFFAGLTMSEIAAVVGRSEATIDRDWAFSKTWLRMDLEGTSTGSLSE